MAGGAPGVAPGVAAGAVAPGAALGRALGAAGVAGLVRHLSFGFCSALFGVGTPLFSSFRPPAGPRRAAASATSGPCANASAMGFVRRTIAAWAMPAFPACGCALHLPGQRII